MSSKKTHYKHLAESDIGKGTVYLEAVGDVIVRQVEIYGSKLVWADKTCHSDDRFTLAEQPLSFLDLDSDDGISASEFEVAWNRARNATL